MNKEKNIINSLEEVLNNIKNEKEHYDLSSIFNIMDNEEEIYESIINYYIKKIRDNHKIEDILKAESSIMKITEFFEYGYDINDEDKRRYYYMISEEANTIIFDLLKKAYNQNERNILLPIKIEYLKDYSISSFIKKEDVSKVIIWIILELAIIEVFN